jgi:hypothetical protein
MAEQETKSKWKSVSALFVKNDEDPVKPSTGSPSGLPVPATIPGRPIPPAQVIQPTVVDQGMVERILAELETSAPVGYKEFVGNLATLADALPTDDLLYKSALKLAGKQGHTAVGLALDYEKCLRLLDEQGRIFDASVQEQITSKVGGRQAELARLDGEITKLNEQMVQLQSQRASEAAAIETDTTRIETTKAKFQDAFAAVVSRLTDQKNKLATFGKDGK